MKEPLTPGPPNSRKYQKYMIWNPKFWPWARRNWLGLITPHPTPSVIDTPEHTKAPLKTCLPPDATLRNTTPTWTNYAARTNLTSPNPANEEGPAALTTSAGIRARPWEDLHYPPANRTAKTTKALNPLGTMKNLKVHPPIPIRCTSPPQTNENPYTPRRNFQESNPNNTAQNAMGLHQRNPATPTGPWEPSLRCPALSRQTPGLASTDGTSGHKPRLWVH
ncbi:hypothetical protein E4T56_gene7424 [Termitomyces sp. T112]|nr:hypothetical protein E4T56_gene7424 [Termitomyces sp. T112]